MINALGEQIEELNEKGFPFYVAKWEVGTYAVHPREGTEVIAYGTYEQCKKLTRRLTKLSVLESLVTSEWS